jgi:hypothetical protein
MVVKPPSSMSRADPTAATDQKLSVYFEVAVAADVCRPRCACMSIRPNQRLPRKIDMLDLAPQRTVCASPIE